MPKMAETVGEIALANKGYEYNDVFNFYGFN